MRVAKHSLAIDAMGRRERGRAGHSTDGRGRFLVKGVESWSEIWYNMGHEKESEDCCVGFDEYGHGDSWDAFAGAR